MYEGVIDDQGRIDKQCKVQNTVPTLRSESHGNAPKALLKIPVREATTKGFAIARGGGEMPSTSRCREVRQEEDESG